MRIQLIIVFIYVALADLTGQAYNDYIGAGHNRGIIVQSSSNEQRTDWNEIASGDKTLSGNGLEGKLSEAARMLAQTTFGYTKEDMQEVVDIGIEAWIDDQIIKPSINYYDRSLYMMNTINSALLAIGVDSTELAESPNWTHWRYAFWDQAVHGQDQLRHRMAYALSQILVISDEALQSADALAGYYDILSSNAFGNYKTLLRSVTLSPTMGYYLSHLNNPREIPEENIHPDQNYAREIMQLFSIGLYQLNNDGSLRYDSLGKAIPTYDSHDIEQLSKVFTGLSIGEVEPDMGDLYFGRGIYGSVMRSPMMMYENWHQQGPKIVLGTTIPDGQSGMKDIEDAIDLLFNHPSCPPFVCKQLIQRFVTSNPSPDYINRVSQVFINDGNGVRGNLAAVIKAIILDDEARSCASVRDPNKGKLTEPIIRSSQYLRNIGVKNQGSFMVNHGAYMGNQTMQAPLSAPSVFNFFRPDYVPSGEISENDLVAPEFQILNSVTALTYPNMVFNAVYYEFIVDNWEEGLFNSYSNLVRLMPSTFDDEVLLNQIDLMFTYGNMSEFTRSLIKDAIKELPPTLDGFTNKIRIAMYLTLISPDYIIQK